MKVIAIYNPPQPGLPYLVASSTDDGAEILQAKNYDTARELAIKLKGDKEPGGKRKTSRKSLAEGA